MKPGGEKIGVVLFLGLILSFLCPVVALHDLGLKKNYTSFLAFVYNISRLAGLHEAFRVRIIVRPWCLRPTALKCYEPIRVSLLDDLIISPNLEKISNRHYLNI